MGEHAKKAFHSNPSNTIFAVKRFIGRKMDDRDIIHGMKRWPFMVSEKNGKLTITVKVKGQETSFVSNLWRTFSKWVAERIPM